MNDNISFLQFTWMRKGKTSRLQVANVGKRSARSDVCIQHGCSINRVTSHRNLQTFSCWLSFDSEPVKCSDKEFFVGGSNIGFGHLQGKRVRGQWTESTQICTCVWVALHEPSYCREEPDILHNNNNNSFGIINWHQAELQKLDRETRKSTASQLSISQKALGTLPKMAM
jgi:hypothetical protein